MHLPFDEPTFGVEVDDADRDAVVVVRGALDLSAVVPLQEAIDRARRPGRPLTIDLSGVTFMDSSGINILLRSRQEVGGVPDAVTLRSPSREVRSTLEMAGVDRMFRLVDGSEGAGVADHADGDDGAPGPG